MTTKLIKRDTNWELYQNESLIASTFDTDLPTITFSDEVAKELGIVDVEKKVQELYKDFKVHPMEAITPIRGALKRFCEEIYNQCLSDNADKKFTEEDVEKAWKAGYNERNLDDFIQSLTKEEYFCEFDREIKLGYAAGTGEIRPKITNNSVKVLKICK